MCAQPGSPRAAPLFRTHFRNFFGSTQDQYTLQLLLGLRLPKSRDVGTPRTIEAEIRVVSPVVAADPVLFVLVSLNSDAAPGYCGQLNVLASTGIIGRTVLVVIVVRVGRILGVLAVEKSDTVAYKIGRAASPRLPQAEAEAEPQDSHKDEGKGTPGLRLRGEKISSFCFWLTQGHLSPLAGHPGAALGFGTPPG